MARQKLILLSGSPCVGKTAAAGELLDGWDNCAYCDGDWCWYVHPFSVTDPRLRNGDKNMSFLLSTYLNSGFDYVIFASVVATDREIREKILRDITARDFDTVGFTLTCSEDTLRARHDGRGDEGEVSFYWLRLPPYPGDRVIRTDGKTPREVAEEIRREVARTE